MLFLACSSFMKDFSQLLASKVEIITQQWVNTVMEDEQIKSTEHLSRQAVENHISDILEALVTVLAQTQESDIDSITEASFHHGTLRAEQDFDPREVVREYHFLRSIIRDNIRVELLQGTPEEILRAVSLIDEVVDAAIAYCFKSYVEARLDELKQVQNEFNLTVEQLRRLVVANQENLSFLAHELKTPLTSIIGYSDTYLRQYRKSNVRDTVPNLGHIERVLSSGRQLLSLINDALEFSRSEAVKMELKLAKTDVKTVIKIVVDTVHPLLESRGLQLVLNCDDAPKEVITDAFRLQQILINLVSNAIRYTEKGSVTVECRSLSNEEWLVSVRDTGIGIVPEDQLRLFKPFERATVFQGKRPTDSTGLGLAIVDRLVDLLQGRIFVCSQMGEGSTFVVIMPLEVKQSAVYNSVV
jgi:signal transduction histidine kinase